MNAVVNRPAVALRPPQGLRAPTGFTEADVRALARRGIDILRRSSERRLSTMTGSGAVSAVYAGQYPATTAEFKQDAISRSDGEDWQWLAASRYPDGSAPSASKVIKLEAEVSTGTGRIDDGTKSTYLEVTLQAHVVQTVKAAGSARVPIVVRRTVTASGYKPRGGPDWWPSVITRTVPYGNTACGLYKGAVLEPLTNPDDLARDIASLKDSLDSPGVTPDQDDATPAEVRRFVRSECR